MPENNEAGNGLNKPISKWKKPIDKKTWIAIAVFVIVVIFILANGGKNSGSSQQPSPAPAKQADMNLAVRQTTMLKATGIAPGNEWVIAIKNLNSFDWKNCDLTMNDVYKSHLDFIDIPSEVQQTATDTHDSMVVTEKNFYKSDGTPFDPTVQRPLKILVACSDPYIGAWEGTLNR